jgi:3',5'-cyclic AMP phosphodiesterase CpdA
MSRKRYAVSLLILLAITAIFSLFAVGSDPIRLGIVADVHAHDTESPVEDKVMSNYPERLTAFVDAMNAWPADLVINLGDFVNGAFVLGATYGDPTRIGGILEDAAALFSRLECPAYYVLGNHDMYDLSKAEFLATVGQEKNYDSFDYGGFHFVIMDAEYNDPGEDDYDHVFMRVKCRIPVHELDWLRMDLAATSLPTIVSIHQPLDSDFDPNAGGPAVVNNAEVRELLSDSGIVVAVLQGHDHENRYAQIDGIHYVTFAAMVDRTEPTPPTWAQVTLDLALRTIAIEGFGLQDDWQLAF